MAVKFLSARRDCTEFTPSWDLMLSLCLKAGNFTKAMSGAG